MWIWLQKFKKVLKKIGYFLYCAFFISKFGRVRIFIVGVIASFMFINVAMLATLIKHRIPDIHNTFGGNFTSFRSNRADILDRNGIVLAKNIFSYNVYVQPSKMLDIEDDIDKLIIVFPDLKDKKEKLVKDIINRMSDPNKQNAWFLIKKHILPSDKDRIMEEGVVGVQFETSQMRVYPHKNMASHILGFTSVDGDGMAGIERSFDNRLKTNAEPLRLSIDINLQGVVRDVLADAVRKNKAKFAFGVVMKVQTGEIISAVSLPDFNPNNVGKYKDDALFNRFSMGSYELGSVFKIFVAALAIESGVTATKTYNTSEDIKIGDYIIHDLLRRTKIEKMNLVDIIRFSSNVGCARVVLEDIGANNMRDFYQSLGFFQKLDIEIKETSRPILPQKWGMTQAITASFGHGIAVTPLHFAVAATAVLNKGRTVKPTFLQIKDQNSVKYGRTVVTPSTSQKTALLLRKVITEGGGKRAITDRYDVGGKSGTAMQPIKGKYSKNKVIVSFFAAVPIDKPKYVFYIGIGEPLINETNHNFVTGGYLVAPIIKELISLAGPLLDIPIIN